MGTKAYLNRITKIKELEKAQKELQAQIDSLKDELKADMVKSGSDEVVCGDYTVRYKAVTSQKFDTAAFKKAHSKMYAFFCSPSTSMRFTIS